MASSLLDHARTMGDVDAIREHEMIGKEAAASAYLDGADTVSVFR